jgi:predicted MPP superfamily phosphohydrolase
LATPTIDPQKRRIQPAHLRRMTSRRRFLQWLLRLGLGAGAAATYATAIEPLLLRTTRYDLRPKHWPAGLDLSLAVLADMHACEPWMDIGRIESVVARTNALNADLILLLGDYAAGHRFVTGPVDSSDWSQPLARLKAPLGVHAILGNHDWWDDRGVQASGKGPPYARRALERVGIPVYENDAVRVAKDGHPFWLAGLGDQLAFWSTRRRYPGRRIGVDDLTATLAKVQDDAPVILLAHEPDILPRVPERVSLVLSGHTHGGQVRLFGWSPVVPSRFGNRFAYGHVREQCDLIVSGGLGCSIIPVRLGVPPEIVLVNLRGEPAPVLKTSL